MDYKQSIKKLHEGGITYSFIANYIGSNRNRIYRFLLPVDNKQYRNLNEDNFKKLKELLEKYNNILLEGRNY